MKYLHFYLPLAFVASAFIMSQDNLCANRAWDVFIDKIAVLSDVCVKLSCERLSRVVLVYL